MTAYLDHAATTPLVDEAYEAVTRALREIGNPSSLHGPGRRARRVVEESRETVASVLGARPSEVVFTGGGTESDNLAVKGLFWAARAADPARDRVIASRVEHHAVLDAVTWLHDAEGARVTWIEVDGLGRVHPDALAAALAADGGPATAALVTVMWANNEVGTVNDVAALAELAHAHGIPFHTDAVQAVGQLDVDFAASGADALTVSAHKVGGPVGVGALLLGRDADVTPLLHGGGQERDVRSGTVDVAGIAGFAAALEVVRRDGAARAVQLMALRDELVERVLAAVPDAVLNGDPSPSGRLPGNAHLSFPGCEGDALLMLLDAQGVACSTGSACTAGVAKPSHVLLAMGQDIARARGSLRFSLGHTTQPADIDELVAVLPGAVERARLAGAVRPSR
ncbi:MAG TPA: cysteine desulfurase family protein [Mycobacteriales bacterium]|nr:cysteine desulfurase family protein [Mycobacteriales bacterium]